MDKSALKIVFFGTPDLSAKILQKLVEDSFDVVGVITEPDKPVGKKQEVLPTPVKVVAESHSIPFYQPQNKAELKNISEGLGYDLGVVAAYGMIIPAEVLEKPKYGYINFHASLLPQLRGASPVQSAILQGLNKTGVTIMIVEEKMDAGLILSQVEIPLDDRITTTELKEKMLKEGIPLLLKTIPEFIDGRIRPLIQDETKATYCGKIEKKDGRVDFAKTAVEEERKTRAYNEWPGAYCFFKDKRLKILDVGVVSNGFGDSKSQIPMSNDQYLSKELGEVFLDENKNLCAKFSDGYWIVHKIQLEGKNAMSAKEFLNGYKNVVGSVLK